MKVRWITDHETTADTETLLILGPDGSDMSPESSDAIILDDDDARWLFAVLASRLAEG